MDIELFLQMLRIDSTSGKEGELAAFLAERLMTSKCRLERFPVETMSDSCPEGFPLPENLLFSWGTQRSSSARTLTLSRHIFLRLSVILNEVKDLSTQ